MDQLRKLKLEDVTNVEIYLKSNFWDCLNIVASYEKYGIKNHKNAKDSGDMYGYFRDANLCGLFLFTNNYGFYSHFTHEGVLKKVDLLRCIKHYKPKVMEGNEEIIAAIWKIFDRTIVWSKYDPCVLMTLDKDRFTNGPSQGIDIVSPSDIDINGHIHFFMKVEQHFGHNYKTVNQLKEKIQDRAKNNEYILLMKDGHIVAQGFIEKNIKNYSILSGIYTSPEYRGNGYGKIATDELINRIFKKEDAPILMVFSDNKVAKNIYTKIGFEVKRACVVAETRF